MKFLPEKLLAFIPSHPKPFITNIHISLKCSRVSWRRSEERNKNTCERLVGFQVSLRALKMKCDFTSCSFSGKDRRKAACRVHVLVCLVWDQNDRMATRKKCVLKRSPIWDADAFFFFGSSSSLGPLIQSSLVSLTGIYLIWMFSVYVLRRKMWQHIPHNMLGSVLLFYTSICLSGSEKGRKTFFKFDDTKNLCLVKNVNFMLKHFSRETSRRKISRHQEAKDSSCVPFIMSFCFACVSSPTTKNCFFPHQIRHPWCLVSYELHIQWVLSSRLQPE